MKNLYALFGLVIITSCATTQMQSSRDYTMTSEQRFAKCIAQNIDLYIGDCVMQTFDLEEGHSGWMEKWGTQDDWQLVVDTNNDISRRYTLGELNAETSNLMFERIYNLTRDIVNNKRNEVIAEAEANRIKKAQMLMALGDALQSSNNTLNGRTGTAMPRVGTTPMPSTAKQPSKITNLYRKSSEYIEGTQKVCVYKGSFNQKTEFKVLNNQYQMCPLTINVPIN